MRNTVYALPGLFLIAGSLSAAEIGAVSGGTTGLKGPERLAQPQVAPASEDAEKSLLKAKTPEGFSLSLWAAEPLLGNPVALSVDEKGRVFAAETYRYRSSALDIRHYMFMLEDDLACRTTEDRIAAIKKNFPKDWEKLGTETEVVRLIEDRDGDGKADASSPYAEQLNSLLDGINSGVLARGNKVWCTNIPNLWLFEGTTEKGVAQKRTPISQGYGVRFSYTGHDMHGLILGPDGLLYFTFGDRGAHVQTREGRTLAYPDEGAVFRCEPDGSHLEPVARGLRNPQELAFDDHGNLFTGDNDSDQGDRERWVYIVEGADSGWRVGWQHHPLGKLRNPWLSLKMWEPRAEGTPFYLNTPILNIPDGPSGVAYYPGTGLPEQYAGHFFICGFKGSSARSSISSLKVAEQGAGFSVANPPADFVSSIQATDLAFGPDSKIYISEWGEGWEGSGRGRIMALSHAAVRQAQSAQIAEVQKLLAAGFDSKADSELGALLSHPDQRIRLEAQWTLAARPGGTKTLATIARANASTLARIHALWGLGHAARLEVRQKNASPLPTLQTALDLIKDADPEVRAQAVRVLGDNRVAEAFAPLKAALDDPQPRVQFFAAQGLGRIGNPLASAPLVELLRKNADADPFLRMAASHALAVLKDSGALQSASTDSSPAVRLGALLAWRSLKDPRLASFLKDPQPLLVREAALAIHDESVDALPALAALDPSGDEQIALRILNVNYRLGSETHAAKLAALAANPAASEPLRIEALALLKEWKKPAARNRLTGNFQPLPARSADPAANALEARFSALLSDPSPALVSATVDALATLAVRKAEPEIQALALKSGAPGAVRARALEALATLKSPALKQAIKSCIADSDPALRVAAMGLLGQLDPDEAAEQLAAVFDKAAVAEKKTILASMGNLKTPKTGAHLARWVAQLAEGKIPAPAQLELVLAAEKQDSEIVRSALAAYKASLPASDPLAPFQILLEGGDRKAGEKLFKEHAVAACMRCHKVAGVGGEAGPELTGIGSQKDRRYLLESILFPNTQIAEGFKTVLLTLNNGEMVAGLLKKESPSELVIQAPVPGAPATPVRRADVKSIDNAPSGMPPNFADLLSKSELRDILEYLAGLREKK